MIPLYDMLEEYYKLRPTIFHMPGHKMGSTVNEYYKDMIKWDVTEIPMTDDLHNAKGAILKAQKLAALAFGADKTFFLVNGSTCGIHAMLLATCKKGDKVVVGRDCHKSVFNILMYIGVRVVFVNPQYNDEFGICGGYTKDDVERVLNENTDAVAVVITSPNYYGICSQVGEIADVVHKGGQVLIVDEAHGAHLSFCDRLPDSALSKGADMVVQSAHKTLPALTQTAYLHIREDRVSASSIQRILGIIETTSPSFILMASLDIARYIMEQEGNTRLNHVCNMIDEVENRLSVVNGIKILHDDGSGFHDKTRLVINVSELGVSGYKVEDLLAKEYNIHVEMADMYNVVCIVTVCDKKEALDKLVYAIEDIANRFKLQNFRNISIPPILSDGKVVELTDVGDAKHCWVPMEDAVGCVSYNMIVPYPPGVPVVIAGQIISHDHIEYIKDLYEQKAIVNGVEDGNIEIIKNK